MTRSTCVGCGHPRAQHYPPGPTVTGCSADFHRCPCRRDEWGNLPPVYPSGTRGMARAKEVMANLDFGLLISVGDARYRVEMLPWLLANMGKEAVLPDVPDDPDMTNEERLAAIREMFGQDCLTYLGPDDRHYRGYRY